MTHGATRRSQHRDETPGRTHAKDATYQPAGETREPGSTRMTRVGLF